jgi:D-sedoheptulose 7-phosphate isomerase
MNFIKQYLIEVKNIIDALDLKEILKIVKQINFVKKNKGRIFFIGVGGSAANSSHAVNDFRKLAGIECYSPVDNVSELTARTNDEGWHTIFKSWLIVSKLNKNDLIFVFSVGGGDARKNVSTNIIEALKFAKLKKAKICGIVGKNGGYTSKIADACLRIPVKNMKNLTPHSEAFQAVIWHLLVSHPDIKKYKTKW